ncbi:MAG: hypothetical protein ACE361_21170 [Aureliella sp.]
MAEDSRANRGLSEAESTGRTQFSDLQMSEREGEENFARVSKLAVAVLPLSIIGLLALVTPVLRPYCWLIAILAFVAYFRSTRNPSLSGATPALIGLGIALTAGFWSLSSQFQTNRYLVEVAGKHAETYLSLLSAGKAYEAMELRKPEVDRLIAGTSLDQVYDGGESEQQDEMREFLASPSTKYVMESGTEAKWEATEGIRVLTRDHLNQIVVKMTNAAASESKPVFVTLERNATGVVGDNSKALWHVNDHFFEDEK